MICNDEMKVKHSHAVSLLYHINPINPLSLIIVGLELSLLHPETSTEVFCLSDFLDPLHTMISLPIISI